MTDPEPAPPEVPTENALRTALVIVGWTIFRLLVSTGVGVGVDKWLDGGPSDGLGALMFAVYAAAITYVVGTPIGLRLLAKSRPAKIKLYASAVPFGAAFAGLWLGAVGLIGQSLAGLFVAPAAFGLVACLPILGCAGAVSKRRVFAMCRMICVPLALVIAVNAVANIQEDRNQEQAAIASTYDSPGAFALIDGHSTDLRLSSTQLNRFAPEARYTTNNGPTFSWLTDTGLEIRLVFRDQWEAPLQLDHPLATTNFGAIVASPYSKDYSPQITFGESLMVPLPEGGRWVLQASQGVPVADQIAVLQSLHPVDGAKFYKAVHGLTQQR